MAKRKPLPKPEPAVAAEGYTVLARRYRPQQFADLVGQEAGRPGPGQRPASPTASPTPTSSPAPAASARPRPPASSPRPSTARRARRPRPATSATSARPSPPARTSTCSRSTAPATAASTRSASSAQNVQYRPEPVALQDLHHRRSPHAHDGGVQRPAQDAGRAAAARQVHLRHHRSAARFPITILSRCQRFDFAGIGTPRIVERLQRDRRRRGACRPTTRPWNWSPAGPAARCAMPNRCSINCWPSAASG